MASANPLEGITTLHINSSAPRALLLLHGAFTSSNEWDLMLRPPANVGLLSYHLMVPDLPSHGYKSSAFIPFDLQSTAAMLATTIITNTQEGKAYGIIGTSLGGYIALYLAHRYPQLVGDGGLFVSGVCRKWPPKGTLMSWVYGTKLWSTTWAGAVRTLWTARRIQNFALYRDLITAARWKDGYRLGQEVASCIATGVGREEDWTRICEGVIARCCVIASEHDAGEEEVRQRGEQCRKGNMESVAYKAESGSYASPLRGPELFAEGIRAWLERESLPGRYVILNT